MPVPEEENAKVIPSWILLVGIVITILILAMSIGIFYGMKPSVSNGLQYIIDGLKKIMGGG